ncbi:MAG: phospholipase D family protein [Pseudomonadota bacterium]
MKLKKNTWLALLLLILGAAGVAEGRWFERVREDVGDWLSLAGARPPASPQLLVAQGTLEVAFSPNGGATEMIIRAINQARERIWVQAYSFTSAPIARALVEAHKRGVKLVVVLDKSQRTANYSEADYFVNHAVPTFIDDQHAIAHNKVMIIDGDTLITGSFNFTKAAEKSNAENVMILRGNPKLAEAYAKNFLYHRAHSTAFTARHGLD